MPRDRVEVLVKDGSITLDGNVDIYYQKAAAEAAVQHLTGVRDVYNQINVKPVVMAGDVKSKIEKSIGTCRRGRCAENPRGSAQPQGNSARESENVVRARRSRTRRVGGTWRICRTK